MQNLGKPLLFHCERVCEKCGATEDCVYNYARDRWCCAVCAIGLAANFRDYGWIGIADTLA